MFNMHIDMPHRVESNIRKGRYAFEEMGNVANVNGLRGAFWSILGQDVNGSLLKWELINLLSVASYSFGIVTLRTIKENMQKKKLSFFWALSFKDNL